MNIPLINTNDKESINTSLIAIKRATEELNNLIKIADEKMAQLDEKAKKYTDDKINALDAGSVGGSGKYISAISETDGKISATASNLDTTVTPSSTQPVTSGGVANAINTISKLVFVDKTDSNDCVDIVTTDNPGSNVNLYRIANASNDAHKPPLSTAGYFILGFNRWTNTNYQFFTQIAVNTSAAFIEESNVYIRQGYKSLNTITWFDWRKYIKDTDLRATPLTASSWITLNTGFSVYESNIYILGNHIFGYICIKTDGSWANDTEIQFGTIASAYKPRAMTRSLVAFCGKNEYNSYGFMYMATSLNSILRGGLFGQSLSATYKQYIKITIDYVIE